MHPTLVQINQKLFWSHVLIVADADSCWTWTGTIDKKTGYGWFSWKHATNELAHRISWLIHTGTLPKVCGTKGPYVLHSCDNRPCVRFSHLFLGTHADNMADMVAKGRQPKGETHHSAKLLDTEVLAIRELYATGRYSMRALAKNFKISQHHVCDLIHAKRRRQHVGCDN